MCMTNVRENWVRQCEKNEMKIVDRSHTVLRVIFTLISSSFFPFLLPASPISFFYYIAHTFHSFSLLSSISLPFPSFVTPPIPFVKSHPISHYPLSFLSFHLSFTLSVHLCYRASLNACEVWANPQVGIWQSQQQHQSTPPWCSYEYTSKMVKCYMINILTNMRVRQKWRYQTRSEECKGIFILRSAKLVDVNSFCISAIRSVVSQSLVTSRA